MWNQCSSIYKYDEIESNDKIESNVQFGSIEISRRKFDEEMEDGEI